MTRPARWNSGILFCVPTESASSSSPVREAKDDVMAGNGPQRAGDDHGFPSPPFTLPIRVA